MSILMKIGSYLEYKDQWLNTIKRHKDKYFRMIGYKDEDIITIHEFRHSHVTLLINEYT